MCLSVRVSLVCVCVCECDGGIVCIYVVHGDTACLKGICVCIWYMVMQHVRWSV